MCASRISLKIKILTFHSLIIFKAISYFRKTSSELSTWECRVLSLLLKPDSLLIKISISHKDKKCTIICLLEANLLHRFANWWRLTNWINKFIYCFFYVAVLDLHFSGFYTVKMIAKITYTIIIANFYNFVYWFWAPFW